MPYQAATRGGGPLGTHTNRPAVDSGTSARVQNISPGTLGTSRTGADPEDIKRLREVLERPSPTTKGFVRTRTVQLNNLRIILDHVRRNKQLTAEAIDELSKVWLDHVINLYTKWVEHDVSELDAYNGDWPHLQPLIKQAFESEKALEFVGVNVTVQFRRHCETIWDSIQGAFFRYFDRINRAGEYNSEAVNVLKQAQLAGLSEEKYRECMGVLAKQCAAWADTTYDALKRAIHAAETVGRDPQWRAQARAAVDDAAPVAMAAEKQAALLGASSVRTVYELLETHGYLRDIHWQPVDKAA